MLAYDRLKRNRDFARVYRYGRHRTGRFTVVHAMERRGRLKGGRARVGFAVRKRTKGSVVRNRMKRVTREAFRLADFSPADHTDIIVTARWDGHEPTQEQLRAEIARHLESLGALKDLPSAATTRTSRQILDD